MNSQLYIRIASLCLFFVLVISAKSIAQQKSKFNKSVGKPISKTESEKLRKNYKAKSSIKTESSFIGKDAIQKLLNAPGAVGVRVYYGLSDEGTLQPILFAADSTGHEIVLPGTTTGDGGDGGTDASMPCPPNCPK